MKAKTILIKDLPLDPELVFVSDWQDVQPLCSRFPASVRCLFR